MRKVTYSRQVNGFNIQYDEPDICPICHHAIKPTELYHYDFKKFLNLYSITFFYLCESCRQSFLTFHNINFGDPKKRALQGNYFSADFIYSAPERFIKKTFDEKLESISPQFCKIYNQALAAETYSLDEISGIGYRKALEFLIKDYAIHLHPEEELSISKQSLSQCIDNYLQDDRLKSLAKASAWIGNDETHYVRKHNDKDIKDLKTYINAVVYFIGMNLIVDEAESFLSEN